MMEEFKAEVDVEKGGSFAGTSPQDVMPKPYFTTIDRVMAYYNVRIRGEGGREGWRDSWAAGGKDGRVVWKDVFVAPKLFNTTVSK
jgi:hypothetical protein